MDILKQDASEARAKELLVRVEKEFYKLNGLYRDNASLLQGTDAFLKNVETLQALVKEDPKAMRLLQQALKERNFLKLAKEFSASYDQYKQSFVGNDARILSLQTFFEDLRSHRQYAFPSLNAAGTFVDKSINLINLKAVTLTPQFVGTIDLAEMSAEVQAPKHGAQLLLKPENLRTLFQYIEKKKLNKSFKLEAEGFRLLWKASFDISVDSSSENIRTLDRLCKELDGQFSQT